jgi:serine/threonine-protein kinase
MAEILLGRMTGMAGFSRPVVVKRIHAQYAADTEFVTMLLDEARIAAGLHHPNVVQVLELGEHDGEVFLVMEYLEGETVLRLARKLRQHKELLLPRLAAHIAAEACAGLAAVHELAVVHRDISPENLFVTYNGVVKILDFGVAKTNDRLTKTQAGHIKGKYAYMAPEQFDAHVDPRSDLFALGIVLHELCTGESLFRDLNPLMISHAIRDKPIPPLSTIKRSVPPALATTCERALERDLDRRWPSAVAMGEALRRFIDQTPGDPRHELRQLMTRLFRTEAAQKRDRLAELAMRWGATDDPDSDPGASTDPDFENVLSTPPQVPTSVATAVAPTTDVRPTERSTELLSTGAAPPGWSATQASTIAREAVVRRRALKPVAVLVGVALSVTLVVAYLLLVRPPEQPATTATKATAPQPVASPPIDSAAGNPPPVTTAPSANPPEVTGPDASSLPAQPSSSPRRPKQATRISIPVSSKPPGAEILLGGERVGTTPARVSVTRAQKQVTLTLRKVGFIDKVVTVNTDRVKPVAVELEFRKFGSGQRGR